MAADINTTTTQPNPVLQTRSDEYLAVIPPLASVSAPSSSSSSSASSAASASASGLTPLSGPSASTSGLPSAYNHQPSAQKEVLGRSSQQNKMAATVTQQQHQHSTQAPPPIRPGQYSRAPSSHQPSSPEKDSRIFSGGSRSASGGGTYLNLHDQAERGKNGARARMDDSTHVSSATGKENLPGDPSGSRMRSQPIIDPKYRLRGSSPEPTPRVGSEGSPTKGGPRLPSTSFSPKKARARSKSRGRKEPEEMEPPRSKEEIDSDFADLLNEMQVPAALRHKLLKLDTGVKASMLKGQATLNLASLGALDDTTCSPPKAHRALPKFGRSQSSTSLVGSLDKSDEDSYDDCALVGARVLSNGSSASIMAGDVKKGKRSSVDIGSIFGGPSASSTPNMGQGSIPASKASSIRPGTRGRSMSFGRSSDMMSIKEGKESPESFATLLKVTDASRLDVGKVKRMRAVVASESPVWISSFIEFGGYSAMLARLEELLGMEWREEQHDDQLLHELLRCFVALATTEIGKGALQSRAPSPFKELVELLFSEKKPGDLSTRKLMVDLLAILFELELPDKAGVTLQRDTSITKPSQFKTSSCSRIAKAAGINSAPSLLVTLLHNPRDPSVEAVVDFITASHTPRPFKTYLLELSGVCRDYFWIFCHSQNRFWRLEDVDQEKVSGPKVPGGMTGGVEFEAMGYLTSHMKLINMIGHSLLVLSKTKSTPKPPLSSTSSSPLTEESMAAYEFHANLFASGIERILQTLRRSSQHYYSPMHLELSRYLSLAHHSKYLLPADLLVWLAPVANDPVSPKAASYDPGNRGYVGGHIMSLPLAPLERSSGSDRQPREKKDEDDERGWSRPISSAADAYLPSFQSGLTMDWTFDQPIPTAQRKITALPSSINPDELMEKDHPHLIEDHQHPPNSERRPVLGGKAEPQQSKITSDRTEIDHDKRAEDVKHAPPSAPAWKSPEKAFASGKWLRGGGDSREMMRSSRSPNKLDLSKFGSTSWIGSGGEANSTSLSSSSAGPANGVRKRQGSKDSNLAGPKNLESVADGGQVGRGPPTCERLPPPWNRVGGAEVRPKLPLSEGSAPSSSSSSSSSSSDSTRQATSESRRSDQDSKGKRVSETQIGPPPPTSPRFPNPFAAQDEPRRPPPPSQRYHQDSIVGSAIKRWEQRSTQIPILSPNLVETPSALNNGFGIGILSPPTQSNIKPHLPPPSSPTL